MLFPTLLMICHVLSNLLFRVWNTNITSYFIWQRISRSCYTFFELWTKLFSFSVLAHLIFILNQGGRPRVSWKPKVSNNIILTHSILMIWLRETPKMFQTPTSLLAIRAGYNYKANCQIRAQTWWRAEAIYEGQDWIQHFLC